MRLASVALLGALAVSSASADPIFFSYNFNKPALAANQNITDFHLSVEVLSSRVGKNMPPKDPSVANKSVPNPFNPGVTNQVPNTVDGVEPKSVRDRNVAPNPQFFYKPESFALKKGTDSNTNDTKPGVPAGTTVRRDTVTLDWDALFFPPTPVEFGTGDQLAFGGTLDIDKAYWQPPNLGIGQRQPPRLLYADSVVLKGAEWTLDQGGPIAAGQRAAHTMKMGMDVIDPVGSGLDLDGLFFVYTNDASTEVMLSDLIFMTSMDGLLINPEEALGTMLGDPLVFLNGVPQALALSYTVPFGSTLMFLFAGTADPFFAVGGVVSADGIVQLGFNYETRLIAPEPAAWLALATAMLLAAAGRRQRRLA